MIRTLLTLCLLLPLPMSASARIIADSDSCTDQGGGAIRCCGTNTTQCHDYTGCTEITDPTSEYQGAWSCNGHTIHCEEGSETSFEGCRIQIIAAPPERTPESPLQPRKPGSLSTFWDGLQYSPIKAAPAN